MIWDQQCESIIMGQSGLREGIPPGPRTEHSHGSREWPKSSWGAAETEGGQPSTQVRALPSTKQDIPGAIRWQ